MKSTFFIPIVMSVLIFFVFSPKQPAYAGVMLHSTPPVEKEKHAKKQQKRLLYKMKHFKKQKKALRHKPDNKHFPWFWLGLALAASALIVMTIGLALSIYLLWFVAFFFVLAAPAALMIYLIVTFILAAVT